MERSGRRVDDDRQVVAVAELADADAEQLGLNEGAATDVYVTVTASSVVSDLTVNLKAPILIRDRRGHQVLNQTPGAKVKTPLFPA